MTAKGEPIQTSGQPGERKSRFTRISSPWREFSNHSITDFSEQGNDISYPEGGTKAWLVVLGAWCAMIPSMGWLNSLAVLDAYIAEQKLPDLPPSTVGWIFSCYAFCLYFLGAQVGQ